MLFRSALTVSALFVYVPAVCEVTLIDSQLSDVTWRDWFNLNGLDLPDRPRQSFDRGALSISAAIDAMGVALETTRFAERELARGDLVEVGPSVFRCIEREVHFLSQRTVDAQVDKVKRFNRWLLAQISPSAVPRKVRDHVGRNQASRAKSLG